jgi:glycosyltransferase involved in cell wall biosynthesis
MRIAIMLRHLDQHGGGVKVYTRELLKEMLAQNAKHEIILLLRTPPRAGCYQRTPLAREVLLQGGSILAWDQWKVPRAIRRLGVDVLFNPKYSIPLQARCKTAWVCHGLDWYAMPEGSPFLDRLSHRFLVPRYVAKADALFAVSETTRAHMQQYLGIPPERVHTVIAGVSDAFRAPLSEEQSARVRDHYQLPDRYVLYSGAIYPPKNFTRLVRAYARVGPAQGVPLVIAGGTNRYLSAREMQEPRRLGIEKWVRCLGWIENGDLPVVYRLAEALLLPSLYESVGMPMMEAMTAGCPVLTSDRHGTREFGQGAALLVDPESVEDIAVGLDRLLNDAPLRATLRAAGLERSREFTWRNTAQKVWQVLEGLHLEAGAPYCQPASRVAHGSELARS